MPGLMRCHEMKNLARLTVAFINNFAIIIVIIIIIIIRSTNPVKIK